MRRFLTLVCLLGLALPAGISISGCVRNPAGNFCNGLGYGLKDTDISSIILQPQTAGISLAYGQTIQVQNPIAYTCKYTTVSVDTNQYHYGTTNNQLVDISPSGQICAGTWNRNTGGGIPDYTYCYNPNPSPSTQGLPYATAFITVTANSVTSNPVEVYIHAPVTAISLVTTPLNGSSSSGASSQQCYSQNQQAALDALGYYDNSGTQTLLCQPSATATVSAFSVNANAVTLTAPNNFVAGESVTFSGLSNAAFLNGQTLSVLPAGLSTTQFEVAASHANTATTSDAGIATTAASNPTCGSSIGTLNFVSSNASVASISPATSTDPLSTITALQPGTTAITATIAQSASSAGYFSTCPPASIKVTLATGATSGVVTQGVTQNLTTSVTDTLGNPITGLSLLYESTNPVDVSATSSGSITATYPGAATVYAVCEPPSCNPAPINEYGLFGTGLALTSNPVSITVPGTTSDYVWFGAPGQSQYFASMQLLTGNPGATVRLPYVPNSMVMDQMGNNLYFGSLHELMIYSTASNSLSAQSPGYPGVVLAASPTGNQLLINDQVRGLFYLYTVSGGTAITYGGMGVAAAWTPDSSTLYIVDSAAAGANHSDRLYVYNTYTGWSTYDLSSIGGAQSLAVTIPGVGAYLAGSLSTVAHAWCPSGTVGNNSSILFYPQTEEGVALPASSALGATLDGTHILGVSLNGSSLDLNDIGVGIPAAVCPGVAAQAPANGGSLTPLTTSANILYQNVGLNAGSGVIVSAVDQVVTGSAPTSSTTTTTTAAPIAFVTYNATSTVAAQLPYYLPQAASTGSVAFANSTSATPPTAALAGAFSPDNSYFFVSTAGDNEVHFISIPANLSPSSKPVDVQQYSPSLPACVPGSDPNCIFNSTNPAPASGIVPVTVITVKPRSIT